MGEGERQEDQVREVRQEETVIFVSMRRARGQRYGKSKEQRVYEGGWRGSWTEEGADTRVVGGGGDMHFKYIYIYLFARTKRKGTTSSAILYIHTDTLLWTHDLHGP